MFVLNGKSEKILGLLKRCGLAEYESKAYFTLLLTEKSRLYDLSKKSSVPHSKIYVTVERLREKGLVDVGGTPKTATPRRFEPYLSERVNAKRREISNLVEAGNVVRETIHCLRPVAVKYRNKYQVFEPKHRRRGI